MAAQNDIVLQELHVLRQAFAQLQTRCDNLEHEVQTLRQAQQESLVPIKLPIDIPQELANIVIDHLHDDAQALKTCSLVSKAWARSARYHLFYTWYITSKNKRSGVNLLKHHLCTFSAFLRRVVYSSTELEPAKMPFLPWSSDSFHINAPDSLHCIIIKNHRVDLRHWGSEADLARFTAFFHNITDLRLCGFACNALTFITVVMQFPSLVNLKLQSIIVLPESFGSGVHEIELHTTLPDSVRVLEIEDVSHPWIWSFIGNESTKALDTFRMKVPSDEQIQVAHLRPYFTSPTGISLKSLGLRFGNAQDEENFFQNVDLRENREVRCLEIGGMLQFDGYSFKEPLLTRLHTMLSIIEITAFKTLVLDVEILDPLTSTPPEDDQEELDPEVEEVKLEVAWAVLDDILAGWQFPLLETLHFRVQHDRIYNLVVPNYIRSRLPKCNANREIAFTFVDVDDQ